MQITRTMGRLRTSVRPVFFRHPVNTILPAAVRAIIQDGVLEGAFLDALRPEFLFPADASVEPVDAGMGQKVTKTRNGLLTPTITPITGSDPSASTYSIEQFSASIEQYGNSMDTNMLASAVAFSSKYGRDVQTLGINAGQSLNRLARTRLYGSYGGGRTWVATTAGASTSIALHDASGFAQVVVNGVPTAVSATNPLNVTINAVANTVTGIAGNTITVGTSVAVTQGQVVLSANAPVTVRPNARTSGFTLTGADTATVGVFLDAVSRLRLMNVPSMADGLYEAHIDAITLRQLQSDADFKQAWQGRGDAAMIRNGMITEYAGIRWVVNNEVPTDTGDGQALTIRRPIVLGDGALIATPFAGMADMLAGTGVDQVPSIALIDVAPNMAVALIARPPQDRLQQVISTSWSWVGDFCVPTDSTSGDSAIVKRGVVVEHV